jgi:hypothetical protein
MKTMNDVPSIIVGYAKVPDIGHAFLRYWHAPWIQEDIFCFRPVAGFQYWLETYVGLHYGFIVNAWFGYLLLVTIIWLCSLVTYRLTSSPLLAVIGCLFGVCSRFYNDGQPGYFLAWYPIHQDLLMMVALMTALVAFDHWLTSASRASLGIMWLAFAFGCLTKEHVFAFPFMAASLAAVRPLGGGVTKRSAFVQVALTTLFVAGLVAVRHIMYTAPRDPHFRAGVIFHKPLMFMYHEIGLEVLTGDGGVFALAVVLAAALWVGLYLRRHRINSLVIRYGVVLPCVLAVGGISQWLVTGSPIMTVFRLMEVSRTGTEMVDCLALLYTIVLVIKYRRVSGVSRAWLLLFFSYLPVISFIGWHYTMPAALFRSIYWPIIGQAAIVDLRGAMQHLPQGLVAAWHRLAEATNSAGFIAELERPTSPKSVSDGLIASADAS